MPDDLQETIFRIKPLADTVVEAATALNQAIQAASAQGLSVRIDVADDPTGDDGDPVPVVRARILKRIA